MMFLKPKTTVKGRISQKANIYNRDHYGRLFDEGKISEAEYSYRLYRIKKRENEVKQKWIEKERLDREWAEYKETRWRADREIAMLNKILAALSSGRVRKVVSKKVSQLVLERNIREYGRLTCYLCKMPIDLNDISIDHKHPVCLGGTNKFKNLEVAHLKCNCSKNGKTLKKYRDYVDAKTRTQNLISQRDDG